MQEDREENEEAVDRIQVGVVSLWPCERAKPIS